jgi:hypothetical protein
MDELNNHLRRESGEDVDDGDDEFGDDIGDVIPINRLYDEDEG